MSDMDHSAPQAQAADEVHLPHAPENVAIWCQNLAFHYREVEVFNSVSFHVHRGEFVALTGKNGAGKSTLLKLIVGLLEPAQGQVLVFGASPRRRIESIGYVPQHTGFDAAFPIRVEEVVGMGRLSGLSPVAKRQKQEDVEWALRQAEVYYLRERPFSTLSGGQRRRVLVARALVGHPKLLVLMSYPNMLTARKNSTTCWSASKGARRCSSRPTIRTLCRRWRIRCSASGRISIIRTRCTAMRSSRR